MRKRTRPKRSDKVFLSKKDVRKISGRLKREKRLEKDLPLTSEIRTRVPGPLTSPGDLLSELVEALKKNDVEPLVKEMIKYAIGDVVGLGMMSQEQFDEIEEFDEHGDVIEESGRTKALEMIPPLVRQKALAELMPYFKAKKGTSIEGPVGNKPIKVTFKIPDNGRALRDTSEDRS